MCSIMGYCEPDASLTIFKTGFDRTISRGPDGSRIIKTAGGLLGFHRLAIMGLDERGMQPFQMDENVVVCNGEIYGFRALKTELELKGYHFVGDSDCELLLPLYDQLGVEMFQSLDAEFALILYDGKRHAWVAARDPLGIRPLFYGYDQTGVILFASEAKNLVGICEKILPFPPGYYYDDGQWVSYRDMSQVTCYLPDQIETACTHIHDLLVEGVRKRLDADAPIGFLVSGGLDSSLVASIAARNLKKPLETFAIGMSTDAIDLKYAREVADDLGAHHHEVIITKEDVLAALEPVIACLGSYDVTTVRASIGMYLVCQYIHQHTSIRVLLTGEISDELFGYKYTDFAPDAKSFQKEAEKRIREVYLYDVLRADRCISVHSLEARVPFGDLAFVDYVMHLDPDLKMNHYHKGKYLLRRAFQEGAYLPEKILMREKAAFSDAVGHSMVDELKAYAETYYRDDEYLKNASQYQDVYPYSKEALLYREIFEKYYPGQGKMLPAYWMPNQEWEGVAVNGPSARYLSNYGDSGK
ncbi:Asparagine synthetase B [glutamine-hydrolyzing] [Clostridiales bacterium CHKCI006]|nr:Asparagine synthetase B [glutamine-hydrolyzing] [Clostridiales bacterium CHKCI006]